MFFNANTLPCITIGADVWGESGIMTGVINAGARLLCTSARGLSWGLCLVLICRGRYGLGGAVLLFILGSNLGGVGRERVLGGEEEGGGVRRGRKKGVVTSRGGQERLRAAPGAARSRRGPAYFFIPLVIGPLNSLTWSRTLPKRLHLPC